MMVKKIVFFGHLVEQVINIKKVNGHNADEVCMLFTLEVGLQDNV